MPLLDGEIQRRQQNVAILCVLAGLLATLSYTGVLTPPHEISDCQDLCFPSLVRLIVVLLESQLYSGSLPVEHNITWNVTYGVYARVAKVLTEEEAIRPRDNETTILLPLQAFFICNAVALLSSLTCLVVAGVRMISLKEVNEEDVSSIETDCLALVLLASLSLMIAFFIAHFQVYYLGKMSIALWILTAVCLVFVIIMFLGCRGRLVAILQMPYRHMHAWFERVRRT